MKKNLTFILIIYCLFGYSFSSRVGFENHLKSMYSPTHAFQVNDCAPVTTFFENFDSLPAGLGFDLPPCWGTDGNFPVFVGYILAPAQPPLSPPNTLIMTGAAGTDINSYVYMPLVSNLSANSHQLKFKSYIEFATQVTLEIGYLTSENDESTYQPISQVIIFGNQGVQEFSVIPGALPANAVRLVFKNSSTLNQNAEVYIDDVSWEALPECVTPTNVNFSDIGVTTVTISWNAPSTLPQNGYEYILSTSSEQPSTTSTPTASIDSNQTTIELSSLVQNTQYYFWLRSVCDTNEFSSWSSTNTFTTLCEIIIPIYNENFDSFLPNCWNKFISGTIPTGPEGAANTGDWQGRNFLNQNLSNAASINIRATFPTGSGWLVSPTFDLSSGGYAVSYDVGATDFNSTSPIFDGPNMGLDDFVYFLISTDGGVSWSILDTFNSNNTPSHLGQNEMYNISEVTSANVKFAFYATSGMAFNDQDYDFFVDNFKVEPALSNNAFAKSSFTISPNPTSDLLYVKSNEVINEVIIYNQVGQRVFYSGFNTQQAQINVSSLNAGSYFIQVISNLSSDSQTFIKR